MDIPCRSNHLPLIIIDHRISCTIKCLVVVVEEEEKE